MDLKVFSPNELDAVLRALRNVAVANEAFTDAEQALLEGVARIHGADVKATALEPIAFADVARVVTEPHKRKRAVQLAIVTALVEGTPSEETNTALRLLAEALGFDEAGLRVLNELTEGHAFMARVDTFRRFARFLRNKKDFPGVPKFVMAAAGIGEESAALAARYRALGNCAKGTIGRAFHDFLVKNEFSFPGEKGGVPLVFHDLGHVLSGYTTDPEGEIQQAAFQAGFSRKDGFTFLLFGILQFHLGLRITPVAQGYQGLFDVNRVLTALQRGASCKVDIGEDFDILLEKDRMLDEVRTTLGIPALS